MGIFGLDRRDIAALQKENFRRDGKGRKQTGGSDARKGDSQGARFHFLRSSSVVTLTLPPLRWIR